MKKTMKLVSLVLAMLMLVACAAACSGSDDEKDEKVLNIYMSADCDTLNAHGTASSEPGTPYSYCSSPLFRAYPNDTSAGEVVGYHYIGDLAKDLPKLVETKKDQTITVYTQKKDADGEVIAGEYESEEQTGKTLQTWEIEIRDEAVWHNGDKLTAEEIVYSWEKLADPALVNPMGNFLYYSINILNAENYNIGAMKWSDVGIKVDGNKITLTVVGEETVNDICNNFTDRSVYPVKKDIYEKGLADGQTVWGTTLDNWMGCGPYKFTAWEEDSVQTYTKNPDHWLADLFHYDVVKVHIIKDMNSRVQMFESGQLQSLTPDANTIDQYLDDPRLVMYGSINVDHIDINCKNTNNPLSLIEENYYRKALYHAINRGTLAKDVFGEQQAVGTYVNAQAGLTSASGELYRESKYGKEVTELVASWSDASKDATKTGYNPTLALDYMKKAWDVAFAGQADKSWDSNYQQEILYVIGGSDDAYERAYAVLEKEWAEIFKNDNGVSKIKLTFKSQGTLSSTDMKEQFGDTGWDLSPNCWGRGVSRTDMYSCFYYYTDQYSGAPNNYFNDAFNAQYKKCQQVAENGTYEELMKETAELEKIYLDCVIHIPLYQNVNYELFAENLVLPTDQYIPSFGWGTIYGDIAE